MNNQTDILSQIDEVENKKNKDWSGDTNSVFKTLGASQHSKEDRQEHDYYATDPKAAEYLLQLEDIDQNVWEPACGEGHLSKIFSSQGRNVKNTDLIDRGYGEVLDFLNDQSEVFDGDIITNPPYSFAKEFLIQSLSKIPEGKKVCMFLKLTFLEGKGRKQMFKDNPPIRIWVSSSRINCAKNGDFTRQRTSGGSAVCYAWFVWQKGFTGKTEIDWFN